MLIPPQKCSTATKASAYLLLGCPLVHMCSMACVVWDPYYLSHIAILEKIEGPATRWAVCDNNYLNNVAISAIMLYHLN